jgi:hypothetical protein
VGSLLRQCRAKMAGCYPALTPKDGGQVALVGKADFLRDQGKRLIGSAHQSFCPLDTPVHHIALRSHPNRLLEAPAEVVGAETCYCCKLGQCHPLIEIRLDVVTHPLQSLARQSVRRLKRDCRRITT